jgi:DNA-binding GntR family transcriptional regulator
MKQSLTLKAYELIKNEIMTCTLVPGQQIAQPQIAERYRLGLTPTREALQRLAQEGYLQTFPRFGYVVTPISVLDIHEIFDLRALLEPEAARLAAIRGTREDFARIMKASEFIYTPGDRRSISQYVARNAEFHRTIAEVAGNRRLADAMSKVLDELTRIFHLGLNLGEITRELYDEHHRIAMAISGQDPDKAQQTSRDEVFRSRDRILEALVSGQGYGGQGTIAVDLRLPPRVTRSAPGKSKSIL